MTDRELDALVAERVIGWRIGAVWSCPPDNGDGRNHNSETKNSPWPAYSTTGDGMLAVVEAMIRRGRDVTIEAGPEDAPRYARFDWRTDDPDEEIGEAAQDSTLPRAVCLAALKACGWKGEA